MRHLLMILLVFNQIACVTIEPHDNFRRMLVAYKGADINSIPSYGLGYKGNLIKQTKLPNGNILNTYLNKLPQGECKYAFEIDKDTNKILNGHIDGDDSACMIVP